MKRQIQLWVIIAALAVFSAAMLTHLTRARSQDNAVWRDRLKTAEANTAVWQARYDSAKGRVDTILVTTTRYITNVKFSTDTLRENPQLIHDTVWVKATLAQADSLRKACTDLKASIVPLKTSCDSTIASVKKERDDWKGRYNAVRPRWYDRIGVNVGYGATESGGHVYAGPQVGVSIKIWP